jgi:hypothetical protein
MDLSVEIKRQYIPHAGIVVDDCVHGEARSEHVVLVHSHNAAIDGRERDKAIRTIHVLGVEYLVRVEFLLTASRSRDIHLIHAIYNIKAVLHTDSNYI